MLEYHTLLMRLAGIDGVIVNWYGRENLFDYATIHRNTTRLHDAAVRARLSFAVCYEDQTIPRLIEAGRIRAADRVAHAHRELDWLRSSWFNEPGYLKLDGKPVLLSFGQGGLTDGEWTDALALTSGQLIYLSEHNRRPAAAGAFDWPLPRAGLGSQATFNRQARDWPAAMAVAFPRFHDIYKEAGVHESWGRIDDDGGKTFETTLDRAIGSGLPLVQLATWNDWGEGTVIEPSIEFGYRDLQVLQRRRKARVEPAFSGTQADLLLPIRLYRIRRSAKARPALTRDLDRIAALLAECNTAPARQALDRLESPDPISPKNVP